MFVFRGDFGKKILAVAGAAVMLAGCSDEPAEQTVAERLAEIEGRELTPAEVAERQEVAQFLCGVDDGVLILLWDNMTRSQLEFQDWVFGQVCRDRSDAYALATGRFASDGSTTAVDSTGDDDPGDATTGDSATTTPALTTSTTAGDA